MDKVRKVIEKEEFYVFCDVNCQPTVKIHDKFIRFNSFSDSMGKLGINDEEIDPSDEEEDGINENEED